MNAYLEILRYFYYGRSSRWKVVWPIYSDRRDLGEHLSIALPDEPPVCFHMDKTGRTCLQLGSLARGMSFRFEPLTYLSSFSHVRTEGPSCRLSGLAKLLHSGEQTNQQRWISESMRDDSQCLRAEVCG